MTGSACRCDGRFVDGYYVEIGRGSGGGGARDWAGSEAGGFFGGLNPRVFDGFPSKSMLSLQSQPLLTP